MQKRNYTVGTLVGELAAFEARYGLSTDQLVELYRAEAVPAHVPRHDAFVWASTSRHVASLRGIAQPA